jgi:hypothetical protein
MLTDSTTHQTIAKATLNLPDEEMADGEVAIKDYAENETMLEALMDAGIISQPTRHAHTGYITVPICKYIGINSK